MAASPDTLASTLDAHPKRDALSGVVRVALLSAARERRLRLGDGLDELLEDASLALDDGAVGDHNALEALRDDTLDDPQVRALLAALTLRGLAAEPPDDDAWPEVAADLSWLSAQGAIDTLSGADDALGEGAAPLWAALESLVEGADDAGPDDFAPRLVAAAALRGRADGDVDALATRVQQPLVRAVLAPAPAPARAASEPPALPDGDTGDSSEGDSSAGESDDAAAETEKGEKPASEAAAEAAVEAAPASARPAEGARASLEGDLVPPPRHPAWLAAWTLTGLIVPTVAWRFLFYTILRAKRAASLEVGPHGVTVKSELTVLGRTMRKSETVIPYDNLARAEREVRFPSLMMYAGLLALALGSFVGVAIATDGARAGSPSLLGVGLGVVAAGLFVDFVMSSLWPSRPGKQRLVVVPRRGRTLAVACADERAADKALRAMARR